MRHDCVFECVYVLMIAQCFIIGRMPSPRRCESESSAERRWRAVCQRAVGVISITLQSARGRRARPRQPLSEMEAMGRIKCAILFSSVTELALARGARGRSGAERALPSKHDFSKNGYKINSHVYKTKVV